MIWPLFNIIISVGGIGLVIANLLTLRRQYRMILQWYALNLILIHLCGTAVLLRQWPLLQVLQIVPEPEPEPEPRRWFWQRRRENRADASD